MIRIINLREDNITRDALPAVEEKARKIAQAANRNTSAPAGITTETYDDYVLIGPTGAAGLPVEIGTRNMGARRYFKRAADAERSK